MHVAEVFSEWISHSAHFTIIPLPLVDGLHQTAAASERHWQRPRVEHPDCPTHNLISSESDSTPQLVGSALTSMVHLSQTKEAGGGCTPSAPISWPRGRPPKGCTMKDGARNSPLSSPDRGGADSDGYSTASAVHSTNRHRRRQHSEKQLIPAYLDMPIFKLTYPNTDVTYTLWRFDVQGWLDQYQEESMMPHIYASLWGYLGRWVCFLEGSPNLTMTELLECMDHAFGDVCKNDTLIRSLYEIRQKEDESMVE